MKRKAIHGMILILLLINILTLALDIQSAQASGTIYIRPDGSIDPPTAPIETEDDVTYTFTDNVHDMTVVEKNSIIIDGNGYTLQGSGDGFGLYLYSRQNVTLTNMNVRNFTYGIVALDSSDITVSGNNVSENSQGIVAMDSSDITVSGNNVSENSYGILLEFASNNKVSNNDVIGNSPYGIFVAYDANNNTVTNNNVTGNGHAYAFGILVSNSANNNVISSNILHGNYMGIHGPRVGSSNNIILDNVISDSFFGMLMWHPGAGNTFMNNSFSNNNFNFEVYGDSLSCYLQNIDASNTIDGKPFCYLINQRNLVIEPSTFPSVGYLALVNSTDIIVRDLNLTKNIVAGVSFAYTNDSRIENVHVNYNGIGIALFSSNNNTITNNYIETNYCDNLGASAYGIDLRDSINNTIYHNNIVNNLLPGPYYPPMYLFVQALDTNPSENYWHHPGLLEGNYWSDYPGVDDGSGTGKHSTAGDGIGDTNLPWPNTSYDNYPLISPWGSIQRSFAVSRENQTYEITTLSNSSITSFNYNETLSQISFNVTGPSDTVGFTNMTVLKELGDTFEVSVDGVAVSFIQTENATHCFLYFTYQHSTHSITVTIGPSPSKLIEELIEHIEQMNLKQGISNSLDAKLSVTLASLEALNSNKRNDAINKLEAVINETEAQREKMLTNEQADYIITEAQAIINIIT